MDKLRETIAGSPIVAVAGAALAGSYAYQAYAAMQAQGTAAATATASSQSSKIKRERTHSVTQRDVSFNFQAWAESLPAPGPRDMQILVDALEGETPNLSDLQFMTGATLKSYGIKPLARTRILSVIKNLEEQTASGTLQLPKIDTAGNAPLSTSVLSSKQDLSDVKSWVGKRVLLRVDYNVPIKDGVVGDNSRIKETVNTIKHILDPKIGGVPQCLTLICHWGRPAGNFNKDKFTLEPCVEVLRELLPGVSVQFVSDCIGPKVHEAQKSCKPGSVILCENLRFHPEEAGTDIDASGKKYKLPAAQVTKFQEDLSSLGDIFVFEAFGVSHRKASSVTGIKIKQRVAGLLMQKELQFYSKVFSQPQRPFLAIVGGAKVSDKIQVIENLLDQCDEIIIGGGMAYTFKKVLEGVNIGSSIFDEPGAKVVGKIMRKAKDLGVKVHLPVDHIIADKFSENAQYGVTSDEIGIPDGWMALDVGPVSRGINKEAIMRAKTILWNGPLGVFELGPFAGGTLSAMVHMAEASKVNKTITVIGGGDTGAASQKFFFGKEPISSLMSHVSTGGGSSLVLMEGKMLPAVPALSDK